MTSRQENATIELDDSSSRSIETMERLKSTSNIPIIISFVHIFGEKSSKVIASLVNLLRTNHNVKSLNCNVGYESTTSLFEALAAGKAGYNLKSLQHLRNYLVKAEVTLLRRYLTNNQNLKRLGVAIDEGQEAVQLVSSLACCTVVELEITVFITQGCLQELGTKLGQCNSIHSLRISFVYPDYRLDDIKSFLKEGLSNMRCLEHIELRFQNSSLYEWQDGFLEMIKSSHSITKAALKVNVGEVQSFHDEVDSFCILNSVFGTNLIGFEPTELWTRVYAKIRDDSARATFLFRLLREKPELLLQRPDADLRLYN